MAGADSHGLLKARRPGWRRQRLRRQISMRRTAKRKAEVDPTCAPAAKRRRIELAEVSAAVAPRKRFAEGIELLGDLAPEAVGWTYPLLEEEWRCFAGYLKGALTEGERARFFRLIHDGTDWLQPSGRWGPLPLRTAWMCEPPCTCKYRYGGAEVLPVAYPAWMKEVMAACMPLCGLLSPDLWPNSCNLNLYVDGQHSVGWHADNESLFQGKFQDCRIISLSLGQTRKFELKCGRDMHRLDLADGDLCTMEGMTQKYYQHRVPKDSGKKIGPRINLTWRWIVKHCDCACGENSQGSESQLAQPASKSRGRRSGNSPMN
eukprot:TRINITY_DN66754_c0_g1_i1.p1 TRINITY_DN66754_c0_g1~~TRINITY_DN66754_c0_g1_i1.p1  ORF type:complete len:318 (-),score=32.05 TRINITY_DN66754_c0_g1_i1:37-990(-)